MTVTWRSPCRVCPQRCSSTPHRGDPVQSAVSGGEVGGGSHRGITDGVPRHPRFAATLAMEGRSTTIIFTANVTASWESFPFPGATGLMS